MKGGGAIPLYMEATKPKRTRARFPTPEGETPAQAIIRLKRQRKERELAYYAKKRDRLKAQALTYYNTLGRHQRQQQAKLIRENQGTINEKSIRYLTQTLPDRPKPISHRLERYYEGWQARLDKALAKHQQQIKDCLAYYNAKPVWKPKAQSTP